MRMRKKFGWPGLDSSAYYFGDCFFGDSFFGGGGGITFLTDFGNSFFGEAIFGDFSSSSGSINYLVDFGNSFFGDCIFGDFIAVYSDPSFGIYQQRKCKEGKITIKMKFYTPYNPQTEPQQLNRSKIIFAVLAWQGLTPEQKSAYNYNAKGTIYSGYNLFVREYLLSN